MLLVAQESEVIVVKYVPIIVPIILALGVIAASFYRPDRALRVNGLPAKPTIGDMFHTSVGPPFGRLPG